ncbi:flavodoxin [Dysgonomonas macrotermitis]|uniref:Flavodoxin n=1 Tax=Dysgonomonas macrotermitis TaxID=1346286 RepID=A0A1M5FT25_9BACT|nr:flavodoxin [Dysgonomonas macrotermitis]SHF94342.1 flavodoxin I [Dysgonomonas macrotermitis]
MKKIGIFFGSETGKTAKVGQKIKDAIDDYAEVDIISIEDASAKDFEKYDNIIAGASTWFDGELPTYWDELLPDLETLKMKGKKVAIFGLGDQKKYPDNFADGVGILGGFFESNGAKLIGFTSTEGYKFDHSAAVRDNKFLGLVIDYENQADKNESRISEWVKQLKKELN